LAASISSMAPCRIGSRHPVRGSPSKKGVGGDGRSRARTPRAKPSRSCCSEFGPRKRDQLRWSAWQIAIALALRTSLLALPSPFVTR